MGFSGVDLNFGCPAKSVNRSGGGAMLLADPALLNRIGWLAIISWMTVGVAVLVSALSGLMFGLWPAWQASKLSPIEALRFE